MYGHGDLLASLGHCQHDGLCTAPPVAYDGAGVRRCAVHAAEALMQLLGASA